MPAYRIYRLKDTARQQFRWAPHTAGATVVKTRDYEQGDHVEAATPYAAWLARRGAPGALEVGDLLEADGGGLFIFKYIGFEEARWYVPEPSACAAAPPVAVP